MSAKYKVWTCKIIIDGDSELPPGFDAPPRQAAEKAIENGGLKVLMNSSGWGGNLTKADIDYLEECEKSGRSDSYYVGAMDAPDDVAH